MSDHAVHAADVTPDVTLAAPAGRGATFAFGATLTVRQAKAELDRLAAALAATPTGVALQLDTSALQHFDSSALALLLQARRLAQARGCRVDVLGLPPRLAELARLYGVAELV